MKALFDFHDILKEVERGYVEPQDETNATANQVFRESRKDKKVPFFIYQALDEANFEKVAGATICKQSWEILENAYKDVEKVKKVQLQILQAKFVAPRMKESKTIAKYFTQVLSIVNQLIKAIPQGMVRNWRTSK